MAKRPGVLEGLLGSDYLRERSQSSEFRSQNI